MEIYDQLFIGTTFIRRWDRLWSWGDSSELPHITPLYSLVDFCLQSGGWVLRQVCRGQHPGWDWGMDVSKPHSWELENECLGPGGKAMWDSRPPLLLDLWDSAAGGRVRGSTEVDSVGRDQTTEGLGRCLRDFRLYIYIYITPECVWGTSFFKVFIEFVTILLLFYVLFFGQEACGILDSWPGIEPAPPALKGEVLTSGPWGKFPDFILRTTEGNQNDEGSTQLAAPRQGDPHELQCSYSKCFCLLSNWLSDLY